MNRYLKKSLEELHEIQRRIIDDPANRNPDKGSIWIYTKSARKKLDDISWAITNHLAEKEKAPEQLKRNMGFTNRLAPDNELALPEAAELTPAERAKLEKKLERIKKELDKVRQKCADLAGQSTQRRWNAERAWDELAKEKMRLIALLETQD